MHKKLVRHLLQQFAGVFPTKVLRRITGQRTLLPFYHLISDTAPPHVKHLYAIKNTHHFVKDLDFLCQHYTPISVCQVQDFIQQDKKLPTNTFLLSFDDGLSECHDVIAPILKQKGIPAIFFLNSAFVDNQALMFRYKASLLIEHLENRPQDMTILNTVLKTHHFTPQNTPKTTLLQVRWKDEPLLNDLARALEIDFTAFLQKQKPYLSTPQIVAMQQDGFDFGSHSINHPTYFTLPLEQQIEQTVKSQQFLEQKFDLKQRYFAFPFTDFNVSNDFFNTILSTHQFDLTFGGAGMKKETIKGQLQRIGLEQQENYSARTIIHTEYCYYMLKALLGKNTIHR